MGTTEARTRSENVGRLALAGLLFGVAVTVGLRLLRPASVPLSSFVRHEPLQTAVADRDGKTFWSSMDVVRTIVVKSGEDTTLSLSDLRAVVRGKAVRAEPRSGLVAKGRPLLLRIHLDFVLPTDCLPEQRATCWISARTDAGIREVGKLVWTVRHAVCAERRDLDFGVVDAANPSALSCTFRALAPLDWLRLDFGDEIFKATPSEHAPVGAGQRVQFAVTIADRRWRGELYTEGRLVAKVQNGPTVQFAVPAKAVIPGISRITPPVVFFGPCTQGATETITVTVPEGTSLERVTVKCHSRTIALSSVERLTNQAFRVVLVLNGTEPGAFEETVELRVDTSAGTERWRVKAHGTLLVPQTKPHSDVREESATASSNLR